MITTEKPTLQEFHIEGVKHITPLNALEAVKNKEAIISRRNNLMSNSLCLIFS